MLFFRIFFATFWKSIETQGFLIGKIGRICKEIMIFEFFVVFYARKVQLFCAETCGKRCFQEFKHCISHWIRNQNVIYSVHLRGSAFGAIFDVLLLCNIS